MKVVMLQCLRGPALALDPGDIFEGDATELARWCERGIAEPLVEVIETPEKPKAKRKPRQRKAVIE